MRKNSMKNESKPYIRAMICDNCGRDWFATRFHWACPWCGYDGRIPQRGIPLSVMDPLDGWKTREDAAKYMIDK